MIVLEFKVKATAEQYQAIDEAIRTTQFIRNKCLRFWMDNKGVGRYDLNKHCRILAQEFSFANELNSMARQSAAERAWSAISRFFDNCKKQIPGKKGYPRFKKNVRSVEYKTTGWKLDRTTCKHIAFTDKKGIGRVKLIGTHDLRFYEDKLIKRVRLVRKADGYYCQFSIAVDNQEEIEPTGKAIGLDMGLKYAYVDNTGRTEPNPRFYRTAEKRLAKLQRRVSKKFCKGQPSSNNYKKARKRLAKLHLKVSRQREEWAKRVARCVIQSADLVAYEDLKVKNMIRNHKLSKSIQDMGWRKLRYWIEYFGVKFGKLTVAVPPHFTTVDCSVCGAKVQKSLSTRTHRCDVCSTEMCRDQNAAVNILQKAIRTAGHAGTWEQSLNAWGDLPSWAVGANLLSNGESIEPRIPRLERTSESCGVSMVN
ncbi:MAG: transposase [Prochloraceae cyanobacterium]|nr:transposase [Prochloraceae cyanobacterium]